MDEFKDWYRETLDRRGIKQNTEARALQVSQGTVSNMMSINTPYYLGVHHIPKSEICDDIMGWLSEHTNYMCIPKGSIHDGSHKDELAKIVKQVSVILENETDARRLKAAFTIIRDQAEEALEDMQ